MRLESLRRSMPHGVMVWMVQIQQLGSVSITCRRMIHRISKSRVGHQNQCSKSDALHRNPLIYQKHQKAKTPPASEKAKANQNSSDPGACRIQLLALHALTTMVEPLTTNGRSNMTSRLRYQRLKERVCTLNRRVSENFRV